VLTGWVNGIQVLTATDTANDFDIPSVLNFFQDDAVTGHNEAGSGFVDYLRIYDTALSPTDAGGPGGTAGVPEPATWTLMVLGFGVLGGLMRRRRRRTVHYNFA
jgi:hypothetical protein